jgi:hypothetical protein
MDFSQYMLEVWHDMPEYAISHEKWSDNRELFEEITFGLFRLHEMTNAYPPPQAKAILIIHFNAIRTHGLR